MGLPDWVFRAAGILFFSCYAAVQIPEYAKFPRVGPYWVPIVVGADGGARYGQPVYFWIARILTDLTFLQIIVAFLIRRTPKRRADRPSRIIVPLIGGLGPLAPFVALMALEAIGSPAARSLRGMLSFGEISIHRFYAGAILLSAGMAFEVWAYGTLVRSLSIVAEARELKTSGPYRIVRHPIYLGQFIAQAGYWLVLVRLQAVWAALYVAFVLLQLYRSIIEEDVLEEAFGERYRSWKNRTFWFVGRGYARARPAAACDRMNLNVGAESSSGAGELPGELHGVGSDRHR